MEYFNYGIAFVGASFILYNTFNAAYSVYKYKLRPTQLLTQREGREYCRALADQKFKLVLIGKDKNSLKGIADELSVECKIISTDLKTTDVQVFTNVIEQLPEDVSLVVNNTQLEYTGKYEDMELDQIEDILAYNLWPSVFITHKIIPRMLKRTATKRCGGIIFLSAQEGVRPVPYRSLYSATMAFLDFLGRQLNYEYTGKIDFLVVNKMKSESCAKIAQASISCLGKDQRTSVTLGNAIYSWYLDLLPEKLYLRIINSNAIKLD